MNVLCALAIFIFLGGALGQKNCFPFSHVSNCVDNINSRDIRLYEDVDTARLLWADEDGNPVTLMDFQTEMLYTNFPDGTCARYAAATNPNDVILNHVYPDGFFMYGNGSQHQEVEVTNGKYTISFQFSSGCLIESMVFSIDDNVVLDFSGTGWGKVDNEAPHNIQSALEYFVDRDCPENANPPGDLN